MSELSGGTKKQVTYQALCGKFCQHFHLFRPAVSIFKVRPGMEDFLFREYMK